MQMQDRHEQYTSLATSVHPTYTWMESQPMETMRAWSSSSIIKRIGHHGRRWRRACIDQGGGEDADEGGGVALDRSEQQGMPRSQRVPTARNGWRRRRPPHASVVCLPKHMAASPLLTAFERRCRLLVVTHANRKGPNKVRSTSGLVS